MLGRMVLPIIFYEDGREVVVTEISELKKYYNNNHLPELIDAVKGVRLEQFFFGHGKDDIRDLIVGLKQQGVNEIEILNQVADIIGVEKLNPIITDIDASFDEILTNDSDTCFVYQSIIAVKKHNITISKPKIVNGSGYQVVNIQQDLFIRLSRGTALTVDSLVFSSEKEVSIVITSEDNCNITFKNCKFTGINVVLEGVTAKFTNCQISKSAGGLIAINSKVSAVDSKFFNNLEGGAIFKDSNFEVDKCEFYENGRSYQQEDEERRYGQLEVIGSSGVVKNSRFYRSVSYFSGIYIKSSTTEIKNCEIFENAGRQIWVYGSKANIESCKVYRGQEDGIYCFSSSENPSEIRISNCEIFENAESQISIFDSKADIENCKIYRGQGSGIFCSSSSENPSEVRISNCEIFENALIQIGISGSKADIENCKIYRGQGDGIFCSFSSEVRISNCEIFENAGRQIEVSGSKADIENCKIYRGQRGGIFCSSSSKIPSEVRISNCEIFENAGSQISISDSKANIENCKIYRGKKHGIYCFSLLENPSEVRIKNCKIFENAGSQIGVSGSKGEIKNTKVYKGVNATGIVIKNSNLKLVGVKTWENKKSISKDTESNVEYVNCEFKEKH